jgi:hypothetical protein
MDRQTQAEQKLIVQFQKWFENDDIKSKVLELREQIGIPPEGILITDEDLKQIGSLSLRPENLPFSERGKVMMCLRGCFAGTREFLEDGQPLFNNMYFKHVLRAYIFFNKFLFDEVRASLPIALRLTNLCDLNDAKENIEEYLGTEEENYSDPEMTEMYVGSQRSLTDLFPIAINIHPEASQRDIIDFIKKNWPHIKALQTRRKNENSKVLHSRTKINESIKERDQFICELHKNGMSTKGIRKELANMQQFLDDGHILKIISKSRKRHEKK